MVKAVRINLYVMRSITVSHQSLPQAIIYINTRHTNLQRVYLDRGPFIGYKGLGYELFPLHLSHFLIAPGTIRPTFYSPQRTIRPMDIYDAKSRYFETGRI